MKRKIRRPLRWYTFLHLLNNLIFSTQPRLRLRRRPRLLVPYRLFFRLLLIRRLRLLRLLLLLRLFLSLLLRFCLLNLLCLLLLTRRRLDLRLVNRGRR